MTDSPTDPPPRTASVAPPPTLLAALERSAGFADFGLRFVDRHERESLHTWDELRRRARAVAAGLVRLGVVPGERVALVMPTGVSFFDSFFGILAAGGVPVPLYPPVRLGRLDEYHQRTARMIQMAGARLVLAERKVRSLLGRTVERARPALGCRPPGELAVDAAEAEAFEAPPVSPTDLALVQFSSGTTVEPKPVGLTHRAVLAQARTLNDFWPNDADGEVPMRQGERGGEAAGAARCGERGHSGVCWLPLYHDMGLIGCVFPALERPAMLTLLPPEAFVARPALWLRALSRHRATISPAPNFAYGLCVHKVRDEEMEGVDLSCWVGALNGAEPVAPRVLAAFRDRFARWGLRPEALTPVYGLSEAALAVTFSPLAVPFTVRRFNREALAGEGRAETAGSGAGAVELVSVGRPLPGFEVRVLPAGDETGNEAANETGKETEKETGAEAADATTSDAPHPSPERTPALPEGRVGRVWVRGPSLMEGYLGRPAATARALVDGWLDTGDLGFLAGGELYLTGRAKDVVILRGRNHSPAEIEQAVEGTPGLRRGCVVAVSHLPEAGPGGGEANAVADVGNADTGSADAGSADTERLLLFVEVADGARAEERAALPAACSRQVLAATGLAVDQVVVVEPGSLPRTSSGKLRRGETLRLHLAGELAAPGAVNVLRLAGELARSGLGFVRAGLDRPGAPGDGEPEEGG